MNTNTKLTKEMLAALLKQLRPIDVALGIKVLCGSPLMPRPSLEVLLQPESRLFWLAALTNFAQSQSHSGLFLDPTVQLSDLFDSTERNAPELPASLLDLLGEGEPLCQQFPQQVVTSTGLESCPNAYFVYRPEGRLIYLQRWYRMEDQVGDFVRDRLQRPASDFPVACVANFQTFFPAAELAANPWQAAACFSALCHDFSVITGGPGTGKTTTVTRLIGLLLSLPEGERPETIKMVAPTGKAADRMRESFEEGFEAMQAKLTDTEAQIIKERKDTIVSSATTIHSFLGSRGGRGFSYHAGNPVSCDVLIVDESSMVDLELFIALFEALPSHCRIILLGDKNQLAAVGTGNVFTDLTGCVESIAGTLNASSKAFQTAFEQISSVHLPVREGATALCGDHVVELETSYRFTSGSPVGQLATLLLETGRLPQAGELSVNCVTLESKWQTPLQAAVADYKAAFAANADAATLLDVIAQVRILCAVRRGDHGVEAINRLLAEHVLGSGVNCAQPQNGLPFMIRHNDKNLGLANGDCGVFRADESGELVAYLPSASGEAPRAFNPFALPEWEAAFALTIHKSQGSEYASVVVVLPEMKRKFITWELVYTAITRAKQNVSLVLPEAMLGQEIPRVQRRSGLRQELLRYPNLQ
jgi:exodeoxyribonuclease V alpha subunit